MVFSRLRHFFATDEPARPASGRMVIFDFDGTIADTFPLALELFYDLTGKGEIPKGEMDRLRGLTLLRAARELQIRPWRIPALLFHGKRRLREQITTVEVFDGMRDVFQQLKLAGYDLAIVSSNSEINIELFLQRHRLAAYFSEVQGGARLFSKAALIARILKHQHVSPKHSYYVGDEVRDVEAAKKIHIHSIAVSWGYNNIGVLKQAGPDALVMDPADIVSFITEKS